MARDFLAIALSTVASEVAFSCGKRILGNSRSSLTPHMLEALVCAKDWLFIPKEGELTALHFGSAIF
uniref:HAT C-terminal dimerisation domain-containing protein n=1 Tax=Hordeum vulgare subsp. vulgare TaxID=112509 RepID=A0A8I7BA77_HORVV